ncbi:hypothetical protein OXPF_05890 [Oxobacter pfennigii]|uniref:Uncharacterized protein n=1 Tax=Oxobacter pfennigii TaxID=36849 RepID=A0A0N8NTU4_9CLOT|nr:hypothetical protein [Oxobacter pfennigii]KPU45800.1 hypothetical protein OXPF_05890 [Oxobacter pfennigii]
MINDSDYSNFSLLDKKIENLAIVIAKTNNEEIVSQLRLLNENIGNVYKNKDSEDNNDLLGKISDKADKVNIIWDLVQKLIDLAIKVTVLWPVLKPFVILLIKCISNVDINPQMLQ